jgi:hypothetical protein
VDLPILVKRVQPQDLDWLGGLCISRYRERYDVECGKQYMLQRVLPDPMGWYAVRTDNACAIATLTLDWWIPGDQQCVIRMIIAEEGCMWQAIHLLRATIEWAKSRNCKAWDLAGDTDADLRSIAIRLGAKEVWPRYRLTLR